MHSTSDNTSVALRLDEVGVRFGSTEALHNISLSIPARSLVALVGPSGAGKTTLLKVCGAALVPTSGRATLGEVSLNGASLSTIRALRSRVGFIHQRLDLVPNVRVIQNVLYGRFGEWGLARSCKNFLFPSQPLREEVFLHLERLGIPEKLFWRTDRLSGGQMQRVAIARALFQRPQILIADEPISSVDPSRARATIELLTQLAIEQGSTLLVSLHNFELAAEFFPRLIGVHQGRVLFDAAPQDIDREHLEKLYRIERHDLLA